MYKIDNVSKAELQISLFWNVQAVLIVLKVVFQIHKETKIFLKVEYSVSFYPLQSPFLNRGCSMVARIKMPESRACSSSLENWIKAL